jgi:predicted signal transduction protein with EAL and GGDEF domain
LARELGIGVIAEGVETADQLRLLHEWGCRQAQGFYFAAPMPAEDVLPLLRSGNVMRWLAGPSIAPSRPRRMAVVKPRRVHPGPKSRAAR